MNKKLKSIVIMDTLKCIAIVDIVSVFSMDTLRSTEK